MNIKEYPGQFWLLCIGSFFFFGSFNMVIPELPAMLARMGGSDYKGLIVSLFTLTAMLSRPFSGRLADSIGRVPVMILGSVVCLICSALYPMVATVNAFLWLRFFHGFSTGFTPTGFTAYIADIVPVHRRGEAMGLLSTFGTLGMAGAPALGGWLTVEWSINATFYASAGFALFSVLIFLSMKETLAEKESFRPKHLYVTWNDLYEPNVLVPAIVMVLTAYAFGVMLTLVPDLSDDLGQYNKGIVFTVFTVSSVAVRIVAGRLSDEYGRPAMLKVSTTLIAISMLVTGISTETWMMYVGGILYGLANGINSPTLFAWAVDLGDERFKGRAFASLYIAMEFGIGIGALISGYLYANKMENFPVAFGSASLLAIAALVYLLRRTEGRKIR